MSRPKPPKAVLETLRKEVNFGCPVENCGIPYLTWHHFDPPYHVKAHNNPEGMIALCPTHHSLAEGGRWTLEQLHDMKINPYLKDKDVVDEFGYLRNLITCDFGILTVNCRNLLEILDETIIGFNIDNEGYYRLNLLIRDEYGNVILLMENNFWIVISKNIFDLRCSAQGRELQIISKSKKINFTLRFDEYKAGGFKGKLLYDEVRRHEKRFGHPITKEELEHTRKGIYDMYQMFPDYSYIPVFKFRGRLIHYNHEVVIKDNLLITHNLQFFDHIAITNAKTAIKISEEETIVGVPW